MQIRPKRNAPDTAQFFEISVGDLRETGRLPNFATRQELIPRASQSLGLVTAQ